jgi:hypothetical protein
MPNYGVFLGATRAGVPATRRVLSWPADLPRAFMRLFTLLVHEAREPAPSLELMTVRDRARAWELATKRLRESPRSQRIEVWEGDVAVFDITRADLS